MSIKYVTPGQTSVLKLRLSIEIRKPYTLSITLPWCHSKVSEWNKTPINWRIEYTKYQYRRTLVIKDPWSDIGCVPFLLEFHLFRGRCGWYSTDAWPCPVDYMIKEVDRSLHVLPSRTPTPIIFFLKGGLKYFFKMGSDFCRLYQVNERNYKGLFPREGMRPQRLLFYRE